MIATAHQIAQVRNHDLIAWAELTWYQIKEWTTLRALVRRMVAWYPFFRRVPEMCSSLRLQDLIRLEKRSCLLEQGRGSVGDKGVR